MQTVTLGRTGLEVSVAGLGAGGNSRLGMRGGGSESQAADLVRAAIDLGVTIIDTAPAYGTEAAVGLALAGLRDGIVVSSKAGITNDGSWGADSELVSGKMLRQSVETSLAKLRTGHIDILHLHGVRPNQYRHCREQLLPELQALREEGKIRFLGVTEGFGTDREHAMLREAVSDGYWDVVMLGMNMVNPSAGTVLLPQTRAANIGTFCMYAVRGALAKKETVRLLVEKLISSGEVDPASVERADPLGFLLADGIAESLTEAAYRFCRHTPGLDVILTGTGSLDHLKQNVAAIEGPPLPAEITQRLAKIFGRVTSATGDLDRPPRRS